MIYRAFVLMILSVFCHTLCSSALWSTKPPQASGADPSFEEQSTCAPRKPSAQLESAEEKPFPILNLPDEMLAYVLEFYCVPDIFDESTVLAPSATWRKVCRRFRYVYDTFGFLQRTQVTIQSPEALATFITPGPLGRRSVDLAWHRITLSLTLLETLLFQQPTELNVTNIGEAMKPHQQRKGLLHLDLPTDAQPTLEHVLPLAALPTTSLRINDWQRLTDISGLRIFSHLTTLDLSFCPQFQNLDKISQLTKLRFLKLFVCSGLLTLQGLGACDHLEILIVQNCEHLNDISALSLCKKLNTLELSHTPAVNIADLAGCAALTTLMFEGLTQDISPLLACANLKKLSLTSCNFGEMTFCTHPTQLEELTLKSCNTSVTPENVLTLSAPLKIAAANLKKLTVTCQPFLETILFEKAPHALHSLKISDCNDLKNILGLDHCKNLHYLYLNNQSLKTLSACDALTHASLHRCYQLEETAALNVWPNLKRLTLDDTALHTFEELAKCQHLVHLDLNGAAARDPDLLSKILKLTFVKRLTFDVAPFDKEAIIAHCAAQGMKVAMPYEAAGTTAS